MGGAGGAGGKGGRAAAMVMDWKAYIASADLSAIALGHVPALVTTSGPTPRPRRRVDVGLYRRLQLVVWNPVTPSVAARATPRIVARVGARVADRFTLAVDGNRRDVIRVKADELLASSALAVSQRVRHS